MKEVPTKVVTFCTESDQLQALTTDEIRSSEGHTVSTYSELVSKLARLAFENPELVLLMRGQTQDYLENERTTLFPSMYRFRQGSGDDFYAFELLTNYGRLRKCELELYHVLQATKYWDRVGRSELARWAILQHYEVCPTPLLDVTHSAVVACSFAFLNAAAENKPSFFLYALGVPQINGAITVSPNQALQIVRLSGVCPPETLRPYFQEGYLLGTYPSVDTLDEKMRYARSEMDCSQRLIAKFRISASEDFWDAGFSKLPDSALYPDEQGEICQALSRLKYS